ncbi:MAG: DUF559 domain-containing protein [Patescibacteria group bacterium]
MNKNVFIIMDRFMEIDFRRSVFFSFKRNKLFYKKYKFVGNGKYWVTNFNPDFINTKSKKIIELYGDYWHNKEDVRKRDKLRIPTYKKYGYKTLVIWEKELKNIIKLTKKLGDFNGK